jgi:signal transduction histidine kinase
MNSLSTRITLWVAVLLAACGIVAGVVFHGALRQAVDARLRGRLDSRLAWLEGGLDVEMDDGEVQLDARDGPANAAESWEIATTDGRLLWSDGQAAAEKAITASKRLSFGSPGAPALPPEGLTPEDASGAKTRPAWERITLEKMPPPVLAAARTARPGLEVLDAWQRTRVKKKDKDAPPTFELRGAADGRQYALRIDGSGRIISTHARESARFPGYQFLAADDRRLDFLLTARTSTASAEAELAATARILWTAGPLVLAATAALLALVIRRQLRPLARMADQASRISPADVADAGRRIDPAGSSTELIRLREAINSMLVRLAQALHRERRFAATAAHELRTPLAQMRLTLDVALRRERDAGEYRRALAEISADLDRLQRLVVGLLQLTRSADTSPTAGRPLPLAPLLAKAAATRAPARFDPTATPHDLWIRGDEELLVSAIGNVLENAARYAPAEPPTVRVNVDVDAALSPRAARESDAWIQVVIADRGPGIPEADRERIFEPLTRLGAAPPSASAGAADGFGLGLAVAREAARASGGDLTCRPRGDGSLGAEFVFRFRRVPPPQDA